MSQANAQMPDPQMGVAITAFESADVIIPCLTSLFVSADAELRVVVVDNASSDQTCAIVRQWAAENADTVSFAEGGLGEIARAAAGLTLLRSPVNGGFAYATNRGLEVLLADPQLPLFWVLNPDCLVEPDTAAHYIRAGADGDFALMGGRTVFHDNPEIVQTDGGRVSKLTGQCKSVNWGMDANAAEMPQAASLDYITGANCVASRKFIEQAGLMPEDYFLYYEEVDWAFRRGDLPLRIAPQARVLHHGGTAIGSGSHDRMPSPFSNYFNYRNRIRFMRRHNPAMVPGALLFGMAKAAQLLLKGGAAEARALLAGMFGQKPPAAIAQRLSPQARALAFGKSRK